MPSVFLIFEDGKKHTLVVYHLLPCLLASCSKVNASTAKKTTNA